MQAGVHEEAGRGVLRCLLHSSSQQAPCIPPASEIPLALGSHADQLPGHHWPTNMLAGLQCHCHSEQVSVHASIVRPTVTRTHHALRSLSSPTSMENDFGGRSSVFLAHATLQLASRGLVKPEGWSSPMKHIMITLLSTW